MPSQATIAVGAVDDVNSPYFNPFAASSSHSSSSSAFTLRDGPKPTLRRRGSEGSARRARTDHDPWAQAVDAAPGAHVRARTIDTAVGSSSGTNLHPLALGSAASSSRSSLAETRPRLKRLLSDLETNVACREDDEDELSERPSSPRQAGGPKERVVIVHEISPKDSLAGVALKYGITLADLRKANQLWPSDPIHLRKVLYIPLDRSHKAKELVLSQLELTSGRPPEDDTYASSHGQAAVRSADAPLTIRRIPVSQLSFFPPPSSSSLAASLAKSGTVPRLANGSRRRDPIPFETTASDSSMLSVWTSLSIPASNGVTSNLSVPTAHSPSGRGQIPSLSSFFNSLPLGRISFDSSTSTPSQISDDQEHELHDVSHRSSVEHTRERRPEVQHVASPNLAPKSNKAAQQGAVELRSYPHMLSEPFPKNPGSGGRRSMPSTPTKRDKSSAYISPEHNPIPAETIRTSQLQPSPAMQLPFKPRADRTG